MTTFLSTNPWLCVINTYSFLLYPNPTSFFTRALPDPITSSPPKKTISNISNQAENKYMTSPPASKEQQNRNYWNYMRSMAYQASQGNHNASACTIIIYSPLRASTTSSDKTSAAETL